MIKGCQKRIIFVKNTGCDLFDEAYFVLKDDIPYNDDFNANIVRVANEVINQSGLPTRKKKSRKGLWCFLLGSFLTTLILTTVFLVIF